MWISTGTQKKSVLNIFSNVNYLLFHPHRKTLIERHKENQAEFE